MSDRDVWLKQVAQRAASDATAIVDSLKDPVDWILDS
jgi:hypothetical protein